MHRRRRRRRARVKGRVIQHHHITYDPPWIVTIYAGEHKIMGWAELYSRRTVSKGFIIALKEFIRTHEPVALDLEEFEKAEATKIL